MAKGKKHILALPDKYISFEELKAVRQSEMIGVLPGFATKITKGDKEEWVESPKPFERTLFSIKD